MNDTLTIGARGSALSLAQSHWIRAVIHNAYPRLNIDLRVIKTSGDKLKTASLARSGTKGLFTRELEQSLLLGKIDAAVHSLKDLPIDLPAGLELGAVAEREDPRDVLITHPSAPTTAPARIFTSSPRRILQARLLWPDCQTKEIRGNIETRLRKLAGGKPGDALLLAAAGLLRLQLIKNKQEDGLIDWEIPLAYRMLPISQMLPAPGQAAIGLEIRAADGVTREKLRCVNHPATWAAVMAERTFLHAMGGGCASPVGAIASIIPHDRLRLQAVVFDSKNAPWRGEITGGKKDPAALGASLASQWMAGQVC
ncbi:MAG: hydroxymethylbilane synthase [Verrucomicrobiae bacterium]|nr:hydroxymethylbilane synthase [Verrucomicrobiae bacterium]